ncbi:MAG: 3-deoxy-8-phosphooctulonate synthase [Candidatus Marinimicrobia bacterium]|nr:3-deoxy-8-phosphooctulonate synthase [Candidatus Neomarinimicrobiota bacterium]
MLNKINFNNNSLPIIAGPCVIESKDHVFKMAENLKKIFFKLDVPFIFKSSFDKANRSSIDSFRGPGLEEGLKILDELKKEFDIPILTDIHSSDQAKIVGEIVDIIQIPAFLCRQTDLLVEASKTKKIVNVKKGQFLSPKNIDNIINKIQSTGNNKILITERGTSFGYNNLVVDMRSIPIMQSKGFPVIFDASHSVQLPSSHGDYSGGDRKMIPILAKAAVASGCNGIFLEVHDNPNSAMSDSSTQFPLKDLESLILSLQKIKSAL